MSQQHRIQLQTWPITQLPGLGKTHCRKLEQQGISTTLDLVTFNGKTDDCRQLAAKIRIRTPLLQRWIAMSALAQLPGVGCQYCGLLLHAGILSLEQLSETPPHQLHRQVMRLQVATLRSSRNCPSPEEIDGWIHRARLLCTQSKNPLHQSRGSQDSGSNNQPEHQRYND